MTFALQVSLAPVWFDPAETTSTSVPFIVLYAVHDALVKAMPGWLGERLDVGWAIDVLHPLAVRTRSESHSLGSSTYPCPASGRPAAEPAIATATSQ